MSSNTLWDDTFDVIVIGSGIGGLTSALIAKEKGYNVCILERSEKIGGVTSYSWGQVWIGNNHLESQHGIPDSFDETMAYLNFISGGHNRQNLTHRFAKTCSEACYHCENNGFVRWKIISGYQDYYYGKSAGAKSNGRFLEVELFDGKQLGDTYEKIRLSPHCPWGITHDELMTSGMGKEGLDLLQSRRENKYLTMGPGLIGYFLKAAITKKIPIITSSLVHKLFVENGRVLGVKTKKVDENSTKTYKSLNGVIIASGAYDWNHKFVSLYEPVPEYTTAAPPIVEGYNLILGSDVNAIIAMTPNVGQGSMVGFQIPGEILEGKQLYRVGIGEMGLPHSILINNEGYRFADESFIRDVVAKIREYNGKNQNYKNIPMYLIIDQNHRNKYFFGSIEPGKSFPPDFAIKANSIEELAQKLSINPTVLDNTIKKFNDFAKTGKDLEFHRGEYAWSNKWVGDPNNLPNPNMGPIEKPPFYAIRYTIVATGEGSAGLEIDEHSNVITIHGEHIKSLFACGNAVAYLDIGAGYQSGFANARGMTFGYIAGNSIS